MLDARGGAAGARTAPRVWPARATDGEDRTGLTGSADGSQPPHEHSHRPQPQRRRVHRLCSGTPRWWWRYWPSGEVGGSIPGRKILVRVMEDMVGDELSVST